MQTRLKDLNRNLKSILAMYIIVLTVGVFLGLIYISNLTDSSADGIVKNINGEEELQDEFTEEYELGKSINSLLMTTHNHILGFAFIFISICVIFNYNSVINGRLKRFLIIEPFISILLTFGSFWLIKLVDQNFYILTLVSAILLYGSYFIMAIVSLYELLKRN